jgi:hypothetical protein
MSSDRLISGWVNPLAFLEVDEPWASATKAAPTVEAVLRFLCPADQGADLDKIVARYREISTEPLRLHFAPAEQRLLDKLVWPLRHAKASYMVGNYLATLALCGMVGEMVAILLWEIADRQVNGRAIGSDDEKALFGAKFERLGQERRVAILGAYGAITDEARQHFERIRLARRRYLHLWSEDHEKLPGDAVACFQSAASLVVAAIGQDIRGGRLVLNPRLAQYLERRGLYEPLEDPDDSGVG